MIRQFVSGAIFIAGCLGVATTSNAGLLNSMKDAVNAHRDAVADRQADDQNGQADSGQSFRPTDAFSPDCTRGKFADGAAIAKIIAAIAESRRIPVKSVFNSSDLHQYLFFIVTDGTGKNADDIFGKNKLELVSYLKKIGKSEAACLKQEQVNKSQFNIANLEKKLKGNGLSPQFPSNPALLAWLVLSTGNSHVKVVYAHGVGADPEASAQKNIQDAATGNSLNAQIDDAYAKTSQMVASIASKDNLAKFVFITTGFSRGAAAARALNNRILKDGHTIGESVLFDTVITQKSDITNGAAGVREVDSGEYSIPSGVTQALHITADNEYRKGFELKPASGSNVVEISLPGAHSDIGGGYGFDGISSVTLQMAMEYLAKAGVPMGTLPREFEPNQARFVIHDSRKVPLMAFDEQLLQGRAINNR